MPNVKLIPNNPLIGNFSASPDSFLGLETSCSDSDPYDNFTLTCTATKPTIVIPNLVIAWTHNGTIETGSVTTTGGNMTTTVTNILSFTTSTASDSGTYRCTASITIPNSPDITTSEESTVTIRPQTLPVTATNVTATPGTTSLNATTAAISFTIPNIAYTPENYSVKYTGAILQTTEQTSIIKMSSDNITATNQEFTIILTGLEEDTNYTYIIDSTNCLGTTSTAEMSFRTIPTLPVGDPMNCANITFLPRDVTLTWTAPALINQNGAAVGYNLVCMNANGVSINGFKTRSTTRTSFTITNVTPFTSYTCELSFINIVGVGPPTQCTFETAQDRPDDGPQNFTSTPTMTTVTFRWSRPSIPNGIITGYQLRVTNLETNAFHIMNISSDQLMYTLNEEGFLSAYNNYTATVTASTVIGFGPISTTAGRTLPDMSSPPLLVTRDITISGTIFTTLPSVDNHTINVTWSPPTTPNGRIMNYTIDVDGYTNGNNLIRRTITDVNKNSFMELITNTTILTPGVPYNVTLAAYNEFGRGMPVEVTVFTRVLTPSVSPSGIRGIRSADGTNMTITWNAVSLEQARGFFEYTIRLTRSSRKRQTTGDLVYRIPYRDTSFIATNLDGQATYGVSMGLSVDDGSGQGPIAGPTSEPIEVVSPDPNTCIMDTTVSADRGTFEWPVTISGSTVNVSCPNGPTGAVATRRCVTNSRWESPNVTSCATTEVSREFRNISKINITIDNVVTVSENLTDLVGSTTDTADQNTDNIQVVSTILNQTATLLSNPMVIMSLSSSELSMTTENTVQILDSIEEWSPNVLETESNNIINSFEKIVDALINQDNFTNITIVEDDIALKGERFQQSEFSGIVFTAASFDNRLIVDTQVEDDDANEMNLNRIASIGLPQSIRNIVQSDSIDLSFTLYNQSVLFPVRDPPPNTIVGSSVIGARIGGVADGTKLPDPVVITLSLNRVANISNPRCVYWNFTTAGGRGNWSTDGCNTTFNTTDDDLSFIACHCDHLTNFACLVDVSARVNEPTQPPQYVTVTLEVVSIVGVCLSIGGLVLTIITLAIFKKLRTREASKFHIQLCLSLIFMLAVFVSGIDRVSVRAGCITVGALIHYFALVAWMWMGAEALLMFQKLVIVFTDITWKYLVGISLICWTLPLLPVIITLAVDVDFYIYLYEPENQSGFCFISDMIPFLAAFLLPVFIILIFNVIIYIIIIRVLILHTIRKNKRMSKSSLKTSDAIKMILSYSGILMLFGLTWVSAVFTFISEPNTSFIVQFFFAFFNAFQGFFIFFFFIILSSDSRDAWKSLLCPGAFGDGMKPQTSTTLKSKTLNSKTMSLQKKNVPRNAILSFGGKNMPNEKQTDFTDNIILENEANFEDEVFSIDDEFMMSEFNNIRFDRQLSARRKHLVEKIEIDFFDVAKDD
ncbi:PREDICTED: adhesion G-protein coupled receptor G6-like [Amphimedon queenslandica]|uniref:G-protein coupled receptors family 2 profile 2 domain-containing protein n=1 Tax=Amphimedon queenslandica TaxID=400682 RepID=A0AAN0J8R4_AMPQE|nr:PREDICTED: adhesion G-protein coupled receptor G6-like [Amphimedon queenslandica]|eukprot:XP_019853121.1 PREDICTED: adhesion G-protein coupled receptor G6-like [Amphimedon queenslandica]